MASAGPVEDLLFQLFIVIVAARLGWITMRWLGQPTVMGELAVGVLIGPSVLGLVDSPLNAGAAAAPTLAFLAELGAVLLLFEVGLESNIRELVKVGRSSIVVALLGVVISFTLGFGLSWLLGNYGVWDHRMLFHVFMGAVFTATSVGITARVLGEGGNLDTPEAKIILGAAVIDDVLAILILAFVASLAAGAVSVALLGLKAAIAIGFLVVSLVAGIALLPRLYDFLDRFGERGVLLPVSVAVAFGLSYASVVAGLAPIIGAFAAGLILAQTRQHERIDERVRPVAELFVPIFFVLTGVLLDVSAFTADLPKVLVVGGLLAIVAVLGKLACGFGVQKGEANRLAVGVGMVPRGEVGLVFALFGLSTIGIRDWEYAAILLVVVVTTFLVPPWLKRIMPPKPSAPRFPPDTLGGTDA